MINFNEIKWIIFDFGGTLDSDGVHSRTLFYNAFTKNNLPKEITWTPFQEIYTLIDQKVIRESLISKSSLYEMNHTMVKLMALELKLDLDINSITEEITNEEALYLNRNRKLLEILSENFSLGIISNFSGNLDIILDEFKLTPYFKFVIDSYHTPYTKPQFEIFKLALDKTKTPANQCLYIGDNPSRDSGPAKKMGMKGICIKDVKSKKEFDQSSYDMMIFSLEDLISLIEKK